MKILESPSLATRKLSWKYTLVPWRSHHAFRYQLSHRNVDLSTLLLTIAITVAAQISAIPQAIAQEEMVASKRECAICHIAEISEFKQPNVTTLIPYDPEPVTEIGRQNVESTERMCFSCHDGFLQDARFLWSHRQNSHPVGVEPSDKISIPLEDGEPILPLNKDGKIFCGTCHFAHGIDWGHVESIDSPLFLRTANIESSLCISCHKERSTGPKDGNHPIHQEIDKIPDELLALGSKFGSGQTIVCQSCHKPHGAPDKRLLVVENPDSHLCDTCHKKRFAHNRIEAAQFGTHPVNIELKNTEVAEELLELGGKLAPDGRIICQTCHKQHLAVPDTSLLVQENSDSDLCRNCHTREFTVENSKHDMNLLDPDLINVREQTVKRRGVCSACHLPHGGMGPKMWARSIQTLEDPMSQTCLDCHREEGLGKENLTGQYSHPVGVEMFPNHDDHKGLPLFTIEGVKLVNGDQGFVTCASCHDPHLWNPLDPTETSKPGDKRKSTNKFLREAAITPATLCISCHQEENTVAGSEHDLKLMAPKERNSRKETAERGGICSACHLPHNGNGPVMWSREQEDEEGIAGLCISCHRKRGIADEKMVGVIDHPNRIDPSLFDMNTELPLFNEKGERDEQGMVDCATCHDLHRWNPDQRISQADSTIDLEGDATNSFLRLPAADKDASLCVECHIDKQWVAGTDHDLSVTAPEALNDAGQTVAQSGICGQCHASHNASDSLGLWAPTPGIGQDAMDTLCRSCLLPEKNAWAKAPSKLVHPPTMIPITAGHLSQIRNGKQDESNLPVYTKEGEQTDFGLITCPTCHDPHQWNANKQEKGSAETVDGDIFNSFLRVSGSEFFYCAACHGQDSLFRYKFFHWEKYKHFHWEDFDQ